MPRRELTGAERRFVSERKIGRLATSDRAGQPHVVPVMYAYAEGSFWISSDPGDRKHRDLEANPRAALVVDEPPPAKSGVTVRGRAEVFTEGEMFERAQDHLEAAGAGGRTRKVPGEQVYVRLAPESVSSWRVE